MKLLPVKCSSSSFLVVVGSGRRCTVSEGGEVFAVVAFDNSCTARII